MLKWRYSKPLVDERQIAEVESKLGFVFPSLYVKTVKEYNGGRPPVGEYNTDKTKERTIKLFLSFNMSDVENVYKALEDVLVTGEKVIPFGIDSFGNYICFNKTDKKIVFLDFETGGIEQIADDYDGFLKIIDPSKQIG
jgi:hypothetical protein